MQYWLLSICYSPFPRMIYSLPGKKFSIVGIFLQYRVTQSIRHRHESLILKSRKLRVKVMFVSVFLPLIMRVMLFSRSNLSA